MQVPSSDGPFDVMHLSMDGQAHMKGLSLMERESVMCCLECHVLLKFRKENMEMAKNKKKGAKRANAGNDRKVALKKEKKEIKVPHDLKWSCGMWLAFLPEN